MPSLRPPPSREKCVPPYSASRILLMMSFAATILMLVGCVGVASSPKGSSVPDPSALQILTTSIASASVGANYSANLEATGGVPPYTWSAPSGTLPAGLQLNPLTGAIIGTPSSAGKFPITVEIQDAHAAESSAKLSLTIAAPPSPSISQIVPSTGPTSGGIAVTISGSNFQSGAMVQFGSIAATAVQVTNSSQIRAVIPAESSGVVNVAVKDSDGEIATEKNAFTFKNLTLQIATYTLPVGMAGNSYRADLTATGGTAPYSWNVMAGALPAGVGLNGQTGVISGIPAAAGSYPVTIKVSDATATLSTSLKLTVSPDPAPAITLLSPTTGIMEGGTRVTITGSHFRTGAAVKFGNDAAASVQLLNSLTIEAITPKESAGPVNVTVEDSDGQIAEAADAFTFAAPVAASPDITVDAGKTLSETGGNDMLAAKNIYASASAPESDGGLYPDWKLISSEFAMTRMRNINGLGDCALDASGKLTGCSRLNNDLSNMKTLGLTPHVVVGQWAPASIGGNPLNWGASQWAQYDALCYAIVNYVVNQYGGTGFSEALFEVGNELDTTTDPRELWLTTMPAVRQGDASRFTQYDTVYRHWASAVDLVAMQTPAKKLRIAAPATGFWTMYYGAGQLWQNQIVKKYGAEHIRVDVVSLHIYNREANDLANYAQSIRQTLIASGNANAEIWVTEWGPSDLSDKYFGAINGSHQGAAWSIYFLLQALKGTVTGGSFLEVRDNQGHDTAGVNADMYEATWDHVEGGTEYPKAVANALSMVDKMAGARKSLSVNPAKPNLQALASSDSSSAYLIVSNYSYLFNSVSKIFSDLSANENVTVAFKNLQFNGPVTVDRYLIDAQTSNLNYWVSAGKLPPNLQASQLQKVESISAVATGGALSLPTRQLGPSATSLWIVHQ